MKRYIVMNPAGQPVRTGATGRTSTKAYKSLGHAKSVCTPEGFILEVETDELKVVHGREGQFDGQKWADVQQRLPAKV